MCEFVCKCDDDDWRLTGWKEEELGKIKKEKKKEEKNGIINRNHCQCNANVNFFFLCLLS